MPHFFLIIFSVCFLIVSNTQSQAVEKGFEFSGTFQNFTPPLAPSPFGQPFSFSGPIVGNFIYDTNTPSSYSIESCDCTGYQQRHINGLWADFDGIRVQANEYVVEVLNDISNPQIEVADVVTVRFSTDFPSQNGEPLLVDGIPFSQGLFRFDFVAASTLLSDSSLPTSLDPSDFLLDFSFSQLGDEVPPSIPDIGITPGIIESRDFLSSDHDLDGNVDGADFLIWQRFFGIGVQNGDATEDRTVDVLDLDAWNLQYGNSNSLDVPLTVVPEPNSFVLYFISLLMLNSSGLAGKKIRGFY